MSDNDNDGNESVRICWIMEGGNYGWFGGPPFGKQEVDLRLPKDMPFREHWHFRGYQPGYVPATLVTGFRLAHGPVLLRMRRLRTEVQERPLHTDAGPRECRVYRHEPAGFGMKGTSEIFLSNQGDNYFRPDDICAAPDGRLYVADWYDGGVGGHGYNNPDQGRIFLLKPKGKKLARREKPGPYANVADAMVGLTSPNLATQFLARERLLAEGEAAVPALTALIADPEPNNAARALWVLDRIGGAGRAVVAAQLKHNDAAFRALAGAHSPTPRQRVWRRRFWRWPPTLRPRSAARSCWPPARSAASKAEAALAQIAATYDGTDRYQLEAINIAAGDRKAELLARLEKDQPLSAAQFPLVELLAPDRAAKLLLARLTETVAGRGVSRASCWPRRSTFLRSTPAGDCWSWRKTPIDRRRCAAARSRPCWPTWTSAAPGRRWTKTRRFAAALERMLDDEGFAIDRCACHRAIANRVAGAAVARTGPFDGSCAAGTRTGDPGRRAAAARAASARP